MRRPATVALPSDPYSGGRAQRPRGEFYRHRRHAHAVDHKRQRYATNDLVGVVVDIERADIALLTDGDALPRGRQNGIFTMLNLAQHHFAVTRRQRKRAQEVAVEPAQPGAERLLPHWNCGLLDRGREHDIEADHLGTAIDDGGEHAADLARPGDRRRAFERRSMEALLVQGDDDHRRTIRVALLPESPPTQRCKRVDRQAAQHVGRRQRNSNSGQERNHGGCDDVATHRNELACGVLRIALAH